jgi:hypothetical protein
MPGIFRRLFFRKSAYPLCILFYLMLLSPATALEPDDAEDDDTYLYARPVYTDSGATSVPHNFHDAGDEDWVKFYGRVDTYTVYVKNVESRCSAIVEIYKSDGAALAAQPAAATAAGQPVTTVFDCAEEGVYFVRVRNSDPEVYGDGTGYRLLVARKTSSPKPEGPGTITGFVSDAKTGEPVHTAVIKTTGNRVDLPDRGYYLMIHQSGEFSLEATAPGYLTYTKAFALQAGETITIDIPMLPEQTTPTEPPCIIEELYGAGSQETMAIRQYRDTVLAPTPAGRTIIQLYYKVSPSLAALCRQYSHTHSVLKKTIDVLLIPVFSGKAS